jgi:hypothetical protein
MICLLQLEQLVVIAECVRQAGICENSGDLGEAANADVSMWADAVAAIQETTSPPPQVVMKASPLGKTRISPIGDGADDPDDGDDDAYSEDFEDEEEVVPVGMRKEWKEQQKRRDVQRQWNIQEAEAVVEELSNVALTPNEMTTDSETEGTTSDGERVGGRQCASAPFELDVLR